MPCQWCADLQDPHEAHAHAKEFYALLIENDRNKQDTALAQLLEADAEARLAEQKIDILIECRMGVWGVVRLGWLSQLEREYARWELFCKQFGINPGRRPWEHVLKRLRQTPTGIVSPRGKGVIAR